MSRNNLGFVVEMKHRLGGSLRYIGARFLDEASAEIVVFSTLAEARLHSFPTPEDAALAAFHVEAMRNIEYRVVEVT